MAELIHSGNLGVAGGKGQGSIRTGVVVDDEVKGVAHVEQRGSGGQDQARGGVHGDSVAAVVSAVVAAEDVYVAGPLKVIELVFAFEGLIGVAVFGDVGGKGPFVHTAVKDALGVEGVIVIRGVIHTGGITLVRPLYHRYDFYRGDGAVVGEFAGEQGLAVFDLQGHCAVFQSGRLGIHPHGDGEYVTGHVDLMAVVFR